MPKQYLYYFIVFNLLFLNKISAQNSTADSAVYKSAINHIMQLYADSVKENLRLYNGTEFTGAYSSNNAGHPFFEYPEPQKGDVFYDGIHYPNVLLSYDLIHDEIIFMAPDKKMNIKLISQKVNWFTIPDHLFVYINEDSNSVNFPGSGFYELLYEASSSVLAKRRKQLYQSPKADEASKYIKWDAYYVRKKNVYYNVDDKHSLLAFCKDHKTEVAKFMKKEKLNFKKSPANTIVKVIDYYTHLKK
jgi:hypothetical protein